MKRIALDLETHLIKPGQQAPKMVCCSLKREGQPPELYNRVDGRRIAKELLVDPNVHLVGANIPFDLGVLCSEDDSFRPLVYQAYHQNRITCVQTRQKLIDIAEGETEFRRGPLGAIPTRYNLAALAMHWLKVTMDKSEDTYRKRYAELEHVPLAEWPANAITYAMDDAEYTWQVDAAQRSWINKEFENRWEMPDEAEQMLAHWAVYLIGMYGVCTDRRATESLKKALEKEQESYLPLLKTSKIIREGGTKDMSRIRALVEESYRLLALREIPETGSMHELREIHDNSDHMLLPVFSKEVEQIASNNTKKTPGGKIATDIEVLKTCGEVSEPLRALAGSMSGAKLLSTYVPILERGTKYPITSYPNVLVDTGRTSWSDPNLQNPPRKHGVRECFIPSFGVFCFVDYDTLELRCLAQVCYEEFGFSVMKDALDAGRDLHAQFAADLLSISYEDILERLKRGDSEAKKYRQLAKAFNFGAPGGMGAEKFARYLKGQGIILSVEEVKRLLSMWKKTWREMSLYFNWISDMTSDYSNHTQVQKVSNRIRGNVHFTQAANGFFQGLAADGAKKALCKVSEECYCIKSSPLYGARPVLFLHDEIGIEVAEYRAHDAGQRLADVMIECMKYYVPDVPITAKPILCRRWYKGAEPVKIIGKNEERLVPSKPFKRDDGTVWIWDDT